MKEHFEEILKYNYLVNRYLINLLSDKPLSRCYLLLSHIQNANHIWSSRILNKPTLYQVWQMHSQEVLHALNKETYKTCLEILNGDLSEEINYKTTTDQSFSTKVSDILFQVTNHAAHHRAQVILEFKAKGVNINSIDYIAYQRQK